MSKGMAIRLSCRLADSTVGPPRAKRCSANAFHSLFGRLVLFKLNYRMLSYWLDKLKGDKVCLEQGLHWSGIFYEFWPNRKCARDSGD